MTAWAGGESVTTQYELESGRVLTATAGDLTTAYLYGMGPVAELTDSWAYSLPDGTNTQRQSTDPTGLVTLTGSYTPSPSPEKHRVKGASRGRHVDRLWDRQLHVRVLRRHHG